MNDYEKKKICDDIRNVLLTENLRFQRAMKDPDVVQCFTESAQENLAWLRSILTCGEDIAPTFIKFSDVISAMLPELKPCIGFNHKSYFHKHNVYEHLLAVVDGCHTYDFTVKMAALLHDIGKPHVYTTDHEGHRHFRGHAAESVRIAEPLLTRLGVSEEEKATVLALIECHDMALSPTKKSVRKVVNEYGADFVRKWAILRKADRDDHIFPYGTNTRFYTDIDGILSVLDCLEAEEKRFKAADLAINGNDLLRLGLPEGKAIGDMLSTLCEAVADGRLDNDRDQLLAASAKIIKKGNIPETVEDKNL